MTEASTSTARGRAGLAMRSLLLADATVLLRSRVSTVLSVLLPIVILVATTFGKSQPRLGSRSPSSAWR